MPEPNQSGLSDNAAGALAYFTIIPAIVFLIVEPYNKSAFVKFHAWQSILLFVAAIVIDIILGIGLAISMFLLPFFLQGIMWRIIELAWLLVWLLCVFNAFNGKRFKLPVIGAFAEQQSSK